MQIRVKLDAHKPNTSWQKFSEFTSASSQTSLSEYTLDTSKAKRASLSSTSAGGDSELRAYNHDPEKSDCFTPTTTLSAPPEYCILLDNGHSEALPPSLQSSRVSLELFPIQPPTLHHTVPRANIFIPDIHYNSSPADFPRSPSPAPFADMVPAPHDGLFLPSLNHARSLDAIRITVHTHSESTDAL